MDAQYICGQFCREGENAEQNLSQAADYFQKAADQGHAKAMNNLASQCLWGKGVPQDIAKAKKYYTMAAHRGVPEAMHSLANTYYHDQMDFTEAVRWYRQAADLGYEGSQYKLGMSYFAGEGVEKDMALALEYVTLAAKHEYHPAVTQLLNWRLNGEMASVGFHKDLWEAKLLRKKCERLAKKSETDGLYMAEIQRRITEPQFLEKVTPYLKCHYVHCGLQDTSGFSEPRKVKLYACSACKQVQYCSTECVRFVYLCVTFNQEHTHAHTRTHIHTHTRMHNTLTAKKRLEITSQTRLSGSIGRQGNVKGECQ